MEWNHLIYFALPAVFCWGMGAMAAYRPGKSLQVVLWTVAGLAIFMAFIVGMWVSLERPPLRTMGEKMCIRDRIISILIYDSRCF